MTNTVAGTSIVLDRDALGSGVAGVFVLSLYHFRLCLLECSMWARFNDVSNDVHYVGI